MITRMMPLAVVVGLLAGCASSGQTTGRTHYVARTAAQEQNSADTRRRVREDMAAEFERLASIAREEETAWLALDVGACSRGVESACYDVQKFWERYPESGHVADVRLAISAGGKIIWARRHPPETEADRQLALRFARLYPKGGAR